MPRVFVRPEAVGADRVRFDADEAHHLRRVLRLRPGALVDATDGTGRLYTIRLAALEVEGGWGTIEACARAGPGVAVRHHPGAGDPEGGPDELARAEGHGARRVADRADGDRARRGPARAGGGARHARWERIAREAVKQCGRVVVPEIDRPRAFADVSG